MSCKPTKTGVSFTWEGAWEFDQMSGTGRVTLRKDGRFKGTFRIKDGDSSPFVAVRTEEPDEPIPPPPSYRDKWRRRGLRKCQKTMAGNCRGMPKEGETGRNREIGRKCLAFALSGPSSAGLTGPEVAGMVGPCIANGS